MIRGLKRLARLGRDARGIVFAEAAISLSVLALTTLGGVEVARYVLLNQKLDRVSASVADLASQADVLSVSDVDQLFAAATEILKPFEFGVGGTVILSSVSRTGANPPVVDWQRSGAGTLNVGSQIGIPGGTATLPEGFEVRSGEEAIVAEVYFDFTPWLAPDVAPPARLYHRSFFRPRLGPLMQLQP